MKGDKLKAHLNEYIKNAYPRSVTTNEIKAELEKINLVRMKDEGKEYKQSNAERRLRQSDSPNIQTLYNDNRSIKGYIYIKQEPLSVPAAAHQLQEQLFKVRHLI